MQKSDMGQPTTRDIGGTRRADLRYPPARVARCPAGGGVVRTPIMYLRPEKTYFCEGIEVRQIMPLHRA
jgi:hypothetical protein